MVPYFTKGDPHIRIVLMTIYYFALHVLSNNLTKILVVSPVWQKLEEENQDFFKAYHLRLMLKHQIIFFNKLLEKQAELMHHMHSSGVESVPSSNGSRVPPCKTSFSSHYLFDRFLGGNVLLNDYVTWVHQLSCMELCIDRALQETIMMLYVSICTQFVSNHIVYLHCNLGFKSGAHTL